MKHFNKIKETIVKGKCNQILLFCICIIALVIPNILMLFTEQKPITIGLCNIFLPLGIWGLLFTLVRKPGKLFLYFFPFVFFNAFQVVLLYLFGQAPIAVDMFLNTVTTNTNEAGELLGKIMPAVISVCVLYLPIIGWSIYSLYHKDINDSFRLKAKKVFAYIAISGVALLVISKLLHSDFKIKNDIFPINIGYNMGIAIDRFYKTENYYKTSKDFTFKAESTHPKDEKEIYVFVIGETARACNFGINGYNRNTTPELSKLENIINYKNVFSQSNTTHKSVPMLMSAISAENYNDIYKEKSIITAFKEAGYKTAFFSNQRPNHSFIDFFGEEADDNIFVKENLDEDINVSDDVLLKYLNKEIKNNKSKKLFIVLHMYGSHFNYYERYPNNRRIFTPDSIKSASKEYRDVLVNAYDNTIVYTDNFLKRVIDMLTEQNAVTGMLYSSDHGECIFDDNRNLFLHSSPFPTYHQLHVPYIIWLSEKYESKYKNKYVNLTSNSEKPISSNLATFHTLLDISGITTPYYKAIHSLASDKYKCGERYYLNDHNEAVPLEKALKSKYDKKIIEEKGIKLSE